MLEIVIPVSLVAAEKELMQQIREAKSKKDIAIGLVKQHKYKIAMLNKSLRTIQQVIKKLGGIPAVVIQEKTQKKVKVRLAHVFLEKIRAEPRSFDELMEIAKTCGYQFTSTVPNIQRNAVYLCLKGMKERGLITEFEHKWQIR